jgi:hypothetical protein
LFQHAFLFWHHFLPLSRPACVGSRLPDIFPNRARSLPLPSASVMITLCADSRRQHRRRFAICAVMPRKTWPMHLRGLGPIANVAIFTVQTCSQQIDFHSVPFPLSCTAASGRRPCAIAPCPGRRPMKPVCSLRTHPRAGAWPGGLRRDCRNGPRHGKPWCRRKTRLQGKAAPPAAFGQGTALARRILQKPGRSDALT